jgi:hypothetical protein
MQPAVLRRGDVSRRDGGEETDGVQGDEQALEPRVWAKTSLNPVDP